MDGINGLAQLGNLLPSSPDAESLGRLMDLLQKTHPIGLAFFDEQDICRYANNNFSRLLGHSADDVFGMPLHTLVPGITGRKDRKPPADTGFATEPATFTLPQTSQVAPLQIATIAVWQDGEYRGVVISAIPTERAQDGKEPRMKAEAGAIELLRNLDENPCWQLIGSRDILSFGILDRAGKLLYLSPRARHLLGLTARGTLPPYNLAEDENFTQGEIPGLIRGVQVGEETTLPPIEYRTDLAGALGGLSQEPMTLRFAFFPVEDRPREPLTTMLISRIRREEDGNQPIVFLQRSESASMLARGVAHEFNNVFASIKAVTAMLEVDIDSSHPGYAYLKRMNELVTRGVSLVRDLTDYVRVSDSTLVRTNVEKYSQRFAQLARLMVPSRVKLEVDVSASGNFQADRKALDQALFNLVHNAVEAVAESDEKKIALNVSESTLSDWQQELFRFPERRVLRISVADSGPGLSEEVREHLFEPYFSTKSPQQSSGLGLSVTQQIIRRHSGVIFAEPEGPLGGAVFTVYLPFRREP